MSIRPVELWNTFRSMDYLLSDYTKQFQIQICSRFDWSESYYYSKRMSYRYNQNKQSIDNKLTEHLLYATKIIIPDRIVFLGAVLNWVLYYLQLDKISIPPVSLKVYLYGKYGMEYRPFLMLHQICENDRHEYSTMVKKYCKWPQSKYNLNLNSKIRLENIRFEHHQCEMLEITQSYIVARLSLLKSIYSHIKQKNIIPCYHPRTKNWYPIA